jgi:GDP-L-fucose synthase
LIIKENSNRSEMKLNSKIYVAGHRGMVGSSIVRLLQSKGYTNLVLRSSQQLDLRNQSAVQQFFEEEKPEYIFLAAAKVGGIHANNTYRADFLYENLMIQNNVIHNAYIHGVTKLLFLGSSCIYPKLADQPMDESALLTGLLEPTNEPYAIAKIAGIKMCDAYRAQYGCDFISAMPTNLYGPNDNYDLSNSHVLPALIRKFHEAKKSNLPEVVMWGTGSPLREFLHVDDLAQACFFLMNNYSQQGHINVGSSEEITIFDLAHMVKDVVAYTGNIVNDVTKPDGTPRKLMNNNIINALGWHPKISLKKGIADTYASLTDQDWW